MTRALSPELAAWFHQALKESRLSEALAILQRTFDCNDERSLVERLLHAADEQREGGDVAAACRTYKMAMAAYEYFCPSSHTAALTAARKLLECMYDQERTMETEDVLDSASRIIWRIRKLLRKPGTPHQRRCF